MIIRFFSHAPILQQDMISRGKLMSGNYSVRHEIVNDVPVLYIIGDMTSDADNMVMKTYSEVKKQCKANALVFNFSETNYINSAGLATIINIIQEMGNNSGRVAFAQLSNHFQKVMEIVGITDFVTMHETNDDAVTALST